MRRLLRKLAGMHPIAGPVIDAIHEEPRPRLLTIDYAAREVLRLVVSELSLLKFGPCCITCRRPLESPREWVQFESVNQESGVVLGFTAEFSQGWSIDAFSESVAQRAKSLALQIHETGIMKSAQLPNDGALATHVSCWMSHGITLRAYNIGFREARFEIGLV